LPVVPGFVLLGEVGRGGMGVVYRARDAALRRDVAIKILQDRYPAEGDAARRFVEESQITAQLQHPGIPPIHQVGALADGRPFLVMKLIKGRTLEELLKERADPATDRGRFLTAFEQVCQAVACAHDRKVIHRDLKPANVMVGAFMEVQVMDWGLAKVLGSPAQQTEVSDDAPATVIRTVRDSEGSFTVAGSVLGTPAFMPPEQAGGEIAKIDERSDVFGLGAILCALLTGKPPFVAKHSEAVRLLAIRGQLGECTARLDGCGAEPDLVALCKKCLAANPDGRPRNAGEVAAAVAGLRADAEQRARRAELDRAAADARTAEQRKRRKVQAVLGITLTGAVALAGFGFWWNERREAEAAADRAARRSRTVASVGAALDDARARTGEAWALADEPDKMRSATDLALAAVRRADGFAAAGEAPDDTLGELAVVRTVVADLDRHARLFVAADEALRAHDIGVTGRPASVATTGRLRTAFRAFGWDPVRTPAETIAAEIAASRVRNKVLGFLSDWAFQSGRDPAARDKIRAVIRAARLRSGGVLADWQRVTDGGDPDGLARFAARPDALTLGPELLCALGRDLADAGRGEAHLDLLRRAADRYPGHVWLNFDLMTVCSRMSPARRPEAFRAAAADAALRPDSALFQMNLGICYASLRDDDRAIACYHRAVALVPNYLRAHERLGAALIRAGDPDGAVTAFREAVRLDPSSARLHNGLGDALVRQHDFDGAVASFREAVRLDPTYAHPHSSLAYLLAAGPDGVRNGKQAVEHAARACELNGWKDPSLLNLLAAAHAEAGDFDKALEYNAKALDFADFEKAHGRHARMQRDLYRQKKPYRAPVFAPREPAPPPREVNRP
jgi:serine/threonine-protein kinase